MGFFTFLHIGQKEVLSTFDLAVYAAAANALEKAGLHYEVSSTYTGHGSRAGGRASSFGERPELATQYQIFVRAGDIERAKAALRSAKNH